MLYVQLKLPSHLKSIYYISNLNPLTTFTYPCEIFLLLPYTQLNFLSALFPWSMFFFKLEPLPWSKFFFELELGIDCLFLTLASFGLSSSLDTDTLFFNMVSIILKPWFHSSTWLTLLYVTCLYKGDGGIWFQCNHHLNLHLNHTLSTLSPCSKFFFRLDLYRSTVLTSFMSTTLKFT